MSEEKMIRKFIEEEEEFRNIRLKYADWNFINNQPPKIRAALKFYIETGDIRRACIIAGMNISLFREILREADIPVIV